MLGVLAILFLVVPLVELAIVVQVADRFGLGTTIIWLILISVFGAWMVKHQGLAVLRRMQGQVESGNVPGREIVDGVLLLVAGAFLLTPGFLTDALGILLLLPPTRALLRNLLIRRFRNRVVVGRYGPTIHDVEEI